MISSYEEKIKKVLAFPKNIMYTNKCCGMIAMKREVAAYKAGFSVERMSRAAKRLKETDDKSLYRQKCCSAERCLAAM